MEETTCINLFKEELQDLYFATGKAIEVYTQNKERYKKIKCELGVNFETSRIKSLEQIRKKLEVVIE